MKLQLNRDTYTESSTTGQLLVDGKFECYILENKVRKLGPKGEGKVAHETAIPAGTYEVVWALSPRLKKSTLRLLAVPFFDGILFHAGNTSKDTDGCLLTGKSRKQDWVGSSVLALGALETKVTKALKTGKVMLTVVDTGR